MGPLIPPIILHYDIFIGFFSTADPCGAALHNYSLLLHRKMAIEKITDISIDGFKIIRFGRDTTRTQQLIGGGLCMAVNTK